MSTESSRIGRLQDRAQLPLQHHGERQQQSGLKLLLRGRPRNPEGYFKTTDDSLLTHNVQRGRSRRSRVKKWQPDPVIGQQAARGK